MGTEGVFSVSVGQKLSPPLTEFSVFLKRKRLFLSLSNPSVYANTAL